MPRQTKKEYRLAILEQVGGEGGFAPYDVHTGQPCIMEGIVTRNAAEFPVAQFAHHVFKYVRKNHVKTDRHWTMNWQLARMAQG